MTSSNALGDVDAALRHLQAALPALKGQQKKDAEKIIVTLKKLVVQLGGTA